MILSFMYIYLTFKRGVGRDLTKMMGTKGTAAPLNINPTDFPISGQIIHLLFPPPSYFCTKPPHFNTICNTFTI